MAKRKVKSEKRSTRDIKLVPITGNIFQFKKPGDTLKGFYQGYRETKIGKRVQGLHSVQTSDGPLVEIWESTAHEKLRLVPKGTYIEIRYDGLGPKKKGRNPFKKFDLQMEEGVKLLDTPAGTPL